MSLTLRFTAYAWCKLRYLQSKVTTELGAIGIATPQNPLLIVDIAILRQQVSEGWNEFDNDALAEYLDQGVAKGWDPEHFMRVWIHTHPGDSPTPSPTDWGTFNGKWAPHSEWSIMFIVAQNGATHATLHQRGRKEWLPGTNLEVEAGLDVTAPFPAGDHASWDGELKKLRPKKWPYDNNRRSLPAITSLSDDLDRPSTALLELAHKKVWTDGWNITHLANKPFYNQLKGHIQAFMRRNYYSWFQTSSPSDDVALYLLRLNLTAKEWAEQSRAANKDISGDLETRRKLGQTQGVVVDLEPFELGVD